MKIKMNAERVAVAHVLERELGWPHMRIARIFGTNRATVSYALKRRKTMLPSMVDKFEARMVGTAIDRMQRAARAAMAKELRAIAAEMTTEE